MLNDAFAVRRPRIDAEGEVSSRGGHVRLFLPQSSSASRFTAGASEFFILSQSGEPKWLLVAAGFVAATITVTLVQEFVEWRSRPRKSALEQRSTFALPIWAGRDGGNDETDRHFDADGRHVYRLDGERNLGFEL